MPIGMRHLVHHQAEARAAIAEGRDEYGHIMLVARLYKAVLLLGVRSEVAAHLPDKLSRAIGARLKAVGYGLYRCIAMLQFLLVDVRVVDPIDVLRAERAIINELRAFVVLVAERLEKVHVDNGCPGGDHDVYHVAFYHVHVHLHTSPRAGTTGERENRCAALISQHTIEYVGRIRGFPRGERHLTHCINYRARIDLFYVDMLNRFLQ